MILPGGMSGVHIAQEAVRLQPSINVLYTTGNAENAVAHNGHPDDANSLISKPCNVRRHSRPFRGGFQTDGITLLRVNFHGCPQVCDPALRRATPVLRFWPEFGALTRGSHTEVKECRPRTKGGRIDG